MRLYVNGRFLTQPLSGVQRYARELLTAVDPLLQEPAEVLVPHEVTTPDWLNLRLRIVSGGSGHAWEQGTLWRESRDGVLLSLGNSGPLRHPVHVLCLHDANIYEIPGAFTAKYRLFHKALRPLLARRAAALITVSHHSAGRLAQHLGIPSERFDIVSNAAEHVRNWPHDETAPERYGLIRGGYLLAVGNQSPNKNIARLVEAHGRAGDALPPLAIAGGFTPGVARARLSGMTRTLGRVRDGDLAGLYRGAAAFVFPSLFEGFGIPPLEAMSMSVPVLCARAGAMPEVLGDAPLWFDPYSTDDMARVMRRFAGLPDADRVRMVRQGHEQAAVYRWSKSATVLESVLARVVAKQQAARRIA